MKNETNYQNVSEDHSCAICLTAYFYPVRITNCKHTFCGPCLQDSSELTGNRKCPLCRTPFTPQNIQKAEQLHQLIQNLYPQIINQKKKRIKNKKVINLKIGNTTNQIPDIPQNGNKFEWKLFVRTSEGQKSLNQYASKVQLQLHPTFRPNKIAYDMKNIQQVQLKRIGWGTFRIGIKIFWKDKYEEKHSQVFHDLDFIPLTQKIVVCHLHEKTNQ